MMTEEAKEKRRAYRRAWYAKNKDKQKEYTERYWERKAAKDEASCVDLVSIKDE